MISASWERRGCVLAFPQGWQWPAETEKWAYERCVAQLPENRYVQMICFPWATLIDFVRKGRSERAAQLIAALQWAPPKTTLIRVTIMQHIYAKDMLENLKDMGITDLFWSHALKEEVQAEGIRIHPFPLFPVCRATGADGDPPKWGSPGGRRYLYSFIGAYQSGLYLSEARRWIFDLPPRDDACVMQRGEWHFEGVVYGEQISGVPQSDEETRLREAREQEYREVIVQSLFSLCPSGSGPNTIRLWESIHLGAIPVIISDHCRLPGDPALWERAAVFVPESREEVGKLPERLTAMAQNSPEIDRRLAALRELSEQFSIDRLPPDVMDFFSRSWRSVVGR